MVGWKDILRPIRDGFRDQLPSRPPREDDEETEKRRRQRELDVSRGFAYLESFEELESWTAETVDPLQRSNTPLLCRPEVKPEDQSPKARLILVHDYAGNYHEYEACQGTSVTKESYSCDYMQYVETFVYFSHKLVCIPPPTWSNSLHRNGVKSLGTFLVEPQSTDIGKILERRASTDTTCGWEYPVATQLANIARVYGFEGWLLNIEKTFPFTQWDHEKMVGFITQLKSELGHGNVIWYDALTSSNMLQYQNALTKQNLAFALAAGKLLTNYAWTHSQAKDSKKFALANAMCTRDVVFGIDVWAQNSQPKKRPRHTYGGGGLSTGVAVARLAGLDLSAGIFAPAWPFEHFPGCSGAVQRSMWDGDELPEDLDCDCEPQDRHARSGAHLSHPITRFAEHFPAGSTSFFHTNFERAFSGEASSGTLTAHIGSTSVLPHITSGRSREKNLLRAELFSNPSRVAVIMGSVFDEDQPRASGVLPLFDLNMTGFLEATIVYRKAATPEEIDTYLEMVGTQASIKVGAEACERAEVKMTLDCTNATMMASKDANSALLRGIRVVTKGSLSEIESDVTLVEILQICIKPQGHQSCQCRITDVKLGHHGKQQRLSWSCCADDEDAYDKSTVPFSNITGPVSYFIISINETKAGRAYGLQFILNENSVARLSDERERRNAVRIDGIGFDGNILCSFACNDMWELKAKDYTDSGGSWEVVRHAELPGPDSASTVLDV